MTNKHLIMSNEYTENENSTNEALEENFEVETTEEENEEVEETTEVKHQETDEAKLARLKRQANQLEKKLGTKKPVEEKSSKQSTDLDHGQKAYLIANGIKGAKEFDFVQKELKKSGEDLDSLIENEYFISKLDKFREVNKTQDAIPKGGRSGGVVTDSVEYWMSKPIEDVPQDMRIKVVNKKREQASSNAMFYNSPKS